MTTGEMLAITGTMKSRMMIKKSTRRKWKGRGRSRMLFRNFKMKKRSQKKNRRVMILIAKTI